MCLGTIGMVPVSKTLMNGPKGYFSWNTTVVSSGAVMLST